MKSGKRSFNLIGAIAVSFVCFSLEMPTMANPQQTGCVTINAYGQTEIDGEFVPANVDIYILEAGEWVYQTSVASSVGDIEGIGQFSRGFFVTDLCVPRQRQVQVRLVIDGYERENTYDFSEVTRFSWVRLHAWIYR